MTSLERSGSVGYAYVTEVRIIYLTKLKKLNMGTSTVVGYKNVLYKYMLDSCQCNQAREIGKLDLYRNTPTLVY